MGSAGCSTVHSKSYVGLLQARNAQAVGSHGPDDLYIHGQLNAKACVSLIGFPSSFDSLTEDPTVEWQQSADRLRQTVTWTYDHANILTFPSQVPLVLGASNTSPMLKFASERSDCAMRPHVYEGSEQEPSHLYTCQLLCSHYPW